MGRRAATVEYLDRLVDWAGGRPAFTRKTGIHASNLAAYLAGTKSITWKRLRSATQEVVGEPPAFVPVLEGWNLFKDDAPPVTQITKGSGLYALYDSAMRVIYFGKATNLYMEVRQTLNRGLAEVRPWTGNRNLKFKDVAYYLSAYTIARGDTKVRHDLEVLFLRVLVNNTFNKKGGNFKRHS